jgi:hypothetical protein
MMDKSVEEEVGITTEIEVKEIDWDESIRLQVSELLCEFYEACESGDIDAPRHNRLRGIYPTIAYDEETCFHPVLLAINIPLLQGDTIHYQYDWHELPLSLNQLLTEIQEKEGLPLEHAGKALSPKELLYEARLALTVTQDDVEFAKEHGWPELMQRVREGTRSTHRLATKCLGRYIIANKRVQRIRRREAKMQKEMQKDSEEDEQEGEN